MATNIIFTDNQIISQIELHAAIICNKFEKEVKVSTKASWLFRV